MLTLQNVKQPAQHTGWRPELPGSGSLPSPAPTQCPVNANQRRRRVGLRLRELVAVAQHFAFGVQHDQKISHPRVETQARQLRRFLRAGGGGQQAFGAQPSASAG
jgi:hypothetical protein